MKLDGAHPCEEREPVGLVTRDIQQAAAAPVVWRIALVCIGTTRFSFFESLTTFVALSSAPAMASRPVSLLRVLLAAWLGCSTAVEAAAARDWQLPSREALALAP